jgi:hypothetical protein
VKFSQGEFTINTSSDSSLSAITVRQISVDDANNAWFTCGHSQGGGLVKFDGESWNLFCVENSSLPSSLVHDVACATDGVVWLATGWKWKDGKIAKLAGNDWDIFGPGQLGFTPHFFQKLELDSENQLYASLDYTLSSHTRTTEDPIIIQFDGSSWRNILSLEDVAVPERGNYPFTIDKENNLWLNYEDYILRREEGNWETMLSNFKFGVLAMKGAPDHGVWIGSDAGITIVKNP